MRYSKLTILWLLLLAACSSPTYFTHEGIAEGTSYRIVYQSGSDEQYREEIVQLLADFEASLSTYNPQSLIARINRNDTSAVVDDYFRTVFYKARQVWEASDGAFDITIAPVVNLWGFGFTSDTLTVPPSRVDSVLQYVGMDKISIVNGRIIKAMPQMMLDCNAIAKGYSVDVVANFLRDKGCSNYLVEIGGEIVAHGVNAAGEPWRIGIDRPADNALPGAALQAVVSLSNRALATSGNYRRFFEIDGVKYAHSIDVKTGYPVRSNLLSATIVASDCITADAWATVCMVSGLDKSLALLKQHPELEAYLIYSDNAGKYQTVITKGLTDSVIEN